MLRDWTDSLKFDGISADVERLFVRLIMKADDYGRFHADPRLLKASCFPLVDELASHEIDKWVQELAARQLVIVYEVAGRKYMALVNYGQRLKQSKAKFPPMPGFPDDWLPDSAHFRELPGTSGNFPLEEKRREVEVEEEKNPPLSPGGGGKGGKSKDSEIPCTLAQAIAYAPMVRMTEEQATLWWHTRNAAGWTKGAAGGGTARKIISWQSDMATSLRWVGEECDKRTNGKRRFAGHEEDIDVPDL